MGQHPSRGPPPEAMLPFLMATISLFFGILITMRPERNERHHKAHIHARYQGKEAVFDIETREIIAMGKDGFPNDQANMVKSWIAIHEQDLVADWELLNAEGTFFKIAPLA